MSKPLCLRLSFFGLALLVVCNGMGYLLFSFWNNVPLPSIRSQLAASRSRFSRSSQRAIVLGGDSAAVGAADEDEYVPYDEDDDPVVVDRPWWEWGKEPGDNKEVNYTAQEEAWDTWKEDNSSAASFNISELLNEDEEWGSWEGAWREDGFARRKRPPRPPRPPPPPPVPDRIKANQSAWPIWWFAPFFDHTSFGREAATLVLGLMRHNELPQDKASLSRPSRRPHFPLPPPVPPGPAARNSTHTPGRCRSCARLPPLPLPLFAPCRPHRQHAPAATAPVITHGQAFLRKWPHCSASLPHASSPPAVPSRLSRKNRCGLLPLKAAATTPTMNSCRRRTLR